MGFLSKLFRVKPAVITESDLRRAIRHEEFIFYYQPEWDLKTGEILGVEALVRWESPTGIIPPNDFIPALESTGVIHEFTPYLLEKTLTDLKRLHLAGYDSLFMSINLSMIQLQDTELPQKITNALDKAAVSADKLECEVTETQAIQKPALELKTLEKLRELNIRLSIDDFGSGHSSFNYLRELNTQKLKIDKEFINSLFEKKSNETILQTIITLGHNLGLVVLAEGIETSEQEQWLRENGCDVGQGFWFSRALPINMLLPFLENQKIKKLI